MNVEIFTIQKGKLESSLSSLGIMDRMGTWGKGCEHYIMMMGSVLVCKGSHVMGPEHFYGPNPRDPL